MCITRWYYSTTEQYKIRGGKLVSCWTKEPLRKPSSNGQADRSSASWAWIVHDKKKDHLGMVRINTIIYYVVLIYPHPKKPPKKGLIELAGTLISSSDIGGSMNVSKLSQCHQIQISCLRCSGWRHVGARRCCLCPRRGPSFSCRVQWPSLHEQLEGWTWSGHMACSYHTSRLLQAWDRSSCRTSGNSRPWHFHPQ